MQRKPGFPVANCNIRIPDSVAPSEGVEEEEPPQRRQQLINYAHSQWGFNNWNWAVTKQDLDFVDMSNGKYTAGVVSFVSVSVKSLDIRRENIGYATSTAPHKGAAIHNSRKCAVTNALRETLLSFGGNVATDLMELLEAHRNDAPNQNQNQNHNQNPVKNQNHVSSDPIHENNQNIANTTANKVIEKSVLKVKKDEVPGAAKLPTGPLKNMAQPVAKAHPMPANVPVNVLPNVANRPQPTANAPRHPPPAPAPPTLRPNSNVSFVLQPVMGGVVPPMYTNPPYPSNRVAPPPPPMFPNFYDYSGPWHIAYEPFDRYHGNVNLNFNMPPKNLVVNSRAGSVECRGREEHYSGQGCWIKPTIFYDGFWTEQKVKKWVAEQVEKQFPDDPAHKQPPPDPATNS
ncbi:uncharacterized protein [Maniola hyperantus]|uniref:uncharacterized protein isoform X1 n=1 Tax=Aphantopus hyperantus TaxID=2795564 RepID=UPI003747A553